MVQAIWKGTVIADSDDTETLEGSHYFPPDDVDEDHLQSSDKTTTCPWKGEARYFDVVVDGEANDDAAWTYPDPKPDAQQIQDHVAFWNGVEVEE